MTCSKGHVLVSSTVMVAAGSRNPGRPATLWQYLMGWFIALAVGVDGRHDCSSSLPDQLLDFMHGINDCVTWDRYWMEWWEQLNPAGRFSMSNKLCDDFNSHMEWKHARAIHHIWRHQMQLVPSGIQEFVGSWLQSSLVLPRSSMFLLLSNHGSVEFLLQNILKFPREIDPFIDHTGTPLDKIAQNRAPLSNQYDPITFCYPWSNWPSSRCVACFHSNLPYPPFVSIPSRRHKINSRTMVRLT